MGFKTSCFLFCLLLLALNVIVQQEAKIKELQKERNLWKWTKWCECDNGDSESIADFNTTWHEFEDHWEPEDIEFMACKRSSQQWTTTCKTTYYC